MMRERFFPALVILIGLTARPFGAPIAAATGATRREAEDRIPLTDLGAGRYLGFTGGLYENGSNSEPADHALVGLLRAARIQPLNPQGQPDPQGAYVLISIGMSNTTQEFCGGGRDGRCNPWTFMGQAATDPMVNKRTLVIVDGARGGQSAAFWDAPDEANYDRIRMLLAERGLSEKQVQSAWVKVANPRPTLSLPAAQADAYLLVMQMGNIVRALKARYPNLQQVFLSSRIYGGYATTPLNPEPYAYESGFAVKWLIQAQIDQMRNEGRIIDVRAGDLNYHTAAPWIAWGPYLWANGLTPRSDGLVWERADFEDDGTHPSPSGERKVGTLLLNFFKTSPYTRCWFVEGEVCPSTGMFLSGGDGNGPATTRR